MYYNLVFAN